VDRRRLAEGASGSLSPPPVNGPSRAQAGFERRR
jgi:hypothetical protein